MNTWESFSVSTDGTMQWIEVGPDGLTTGKAYLTYPDNYFVNGSGYYSLTAALLQASMYFDATGIVPTVTTSKGQTIPTRRDSRGNVLVEMDA